VAQVVEHLPSKLKTLDPEFKPQYCIKQKTKTTLPTKNPCETQNKQTKTRKQALDFSIGEKKVIFFSPLKTSLPLLYKLLY
jgi:hypothetical protein